MRCIVKQHRDLGLAINESNSNKKEKLEDQFIAFSF